MIKFTLDVILNTKGKTRYWLSKETGIDNNTLAKIYNNEAKQIQLATLEKICRALDCNLNDIMSMDIK